MKHWRLVYLAIPLTVLVFAGIAIWNGRTAGEEPAEGIGRVPTVRRYAASAREEEIPSLPVYDEYTEGEGEAPAWWDPEEEMAAEWVADVADINVGNKSAKDAGCPDWNLDSTLYGWDGHTAEAWEMDLFARIFYLEFWQPDMVLCEAGCDAILRLWESEYYSPTLYGTLSAVAENGELAFSTYGYVWDWDYDQEGLAWCRAYCEERFYSGPEWIAPFFRKGCYHDWAVPCYQIGEIYFSTGKGWQ